MEITPEAVAAAVGQFSSVRGQGTLPNLLAFGRALKQLGVKVSLSQVIDASRSVEFVDIADKGRLPRATQVQFDFPKRGLSGV